MGELTIQGLGIADLADRYGTPMYVYDGDVLRRQYQACGSSCIPRWRSSTH
jgi:diaminopimelate decarboxylase